MKKWILVFFAILGLADASYLTWEHYHFSIPPCPAKTILPILIDCGTVLRSEYSLLFGVPLAVWGMFHYGSLILWLWLSAAKKLKWSIFLALGQTIAGLCMSLYFVYLQIAVLQAICLYCMMSALLSIVLFLCTHAVYRLERKELLANIFGWCYRTIIKPMLFRMNPEVVHELMVRSGEIIFTLPFVSSVVSLLFRPNLPVLQQRVSGLVFDRPFGLAAGFDYEARLTGVLDSWGFGFQTVGTITEMPWQGNPSPRLGRLPKSQSLLVNKGFRNPGAEKIITKLSGKQFKNNVGVSIGDPKGDIDHILETFRLFEVSAVNHAYYELNISCPNLEAAKSLYDLKRLKTLLTGIDALKLKRPVFVKMPIEKSDAEFVGLLKEISKHTIVGIVVGNLQKDRSDPSFDAMEISNAGKGNFSGKPTFERSNHFISLAYKHFGKRLVIVGCGGVFCAKDAFVKILNGASLIQLITGMIYQGPQVVAEIEIGLAQLLVDHGYANFADAVGKSVSKNSE